MSRRDIASRVASDEELAAQRVGDAALAARALELGRELGARLRERCGSLANAVRAAGVRCERREKGGLVAGLCLVSEYHDADGLIVLYGDALAELGARVSALGFESCFTPEVLADLAVAHELFHRIHRREERDRFDAALARSRAAEEVAAHAFAAAFHGLGRSALVLDAKAP